MAWRCKDLLMGIIRAHLRLANDAKPDLADSRRVMDIARNTLRQRWPLLRVPPSASPTPRQVRPATACREA